jgi:hypothetical protein
MVERRQCWLLSFPLVPFRIAWSKEVERYVMLVAGMLMSGTAVVVVDTGWVQLLA